MAWLDTGTFDSLHEAGAYIRTLEQRQGQGSPRRGGLAPGLIKDEQLERLAQPLLKSGYGAYLLQMLRRQTMRCCSATWKSGPKGSSCRLKRSAPPPASPSAARY